MQNNNYQNTVYPHTPPGYVPYYPPVPPPPDPKQLQRRALRKTANGLGFFILAYFLIMQVLVIVVSLMIQRSGITTEDNQTMILFLLEIIASVASSLLAVVFYKMISRKRLSENLSKSNLSRDMLVPMIFAGMGAAMLANQLASLFDQNISIFYLENSVSQTTQTRSMPEMILYILSTAVAPAFAEELAFRGVFMNVMRKYGDAFAIITSAVLFGAMHGNTTQIVFAFILGLIFAFVDCKANSILPSVIIHFTNNFYAVASDIIQTNSGMSDTVVSVIRIIIIALFCVLGILSYLYLTRRDKNFFRISDSDQGPYAEKSLLTLKEKHIACFTTPGIIISLSLFMLEMFLNLVPTV